MATSTTTSVFGRAVDRIEGVDKVTGAAHYSGEQPIPDVAYVVGIQSTVARGRIRGVDARDARSMSGVIEVLSHENAPRLHPVADAELALFQSAEIAYRGQFIAAVVATTLEVARDAARAVHIDEAGQEHDVELRSDSVDLTKPERINAGYETDSGLGDIELGFADSPVQVDERYMTPAQHNNPIEPHASLAFWEGDNLTVYDSSQGTTSARDTLAAVFGVDPSSVRVIAEHVGGGFGSKGMPHPPVVLAAMAARMTRRAVKLAVTRQQMFAVTGYRTPTLQRVRLAAQGDGRLVAIEHDVVEQSSTLHEFAEQTAVCTRWMYDAPHRLTTHRLARLDVPTPSWMRAPGECPGMFALESAMDELAIACGIDPVDLRIVNEPEVHPEEPLRFSSRNLVACLRDGAERFGWVGRDPRPGVRRDGRWLVGTGVASSTYPAYLRACEATARVDADGRFTLRINGTDIGTGARTALTQIAADALGVPLGQVRVEIGDSALPAANVAGGSSGTASWGSAVAKAGRALRAAMSERSVPPEGLEVRIDTRPEVEGRPQLAYYAFGAQFVEARVDPDTGEVRVPRVVGVFDIGRIVNPKTARSQLIGGITMGVSMALFEESVMDTRFGDYVDHDFASYHIATNADIGEIDVSWLDEDDPNANLIGVKGIGEIGIVGAAAAVANAVHHATGIRVRALPIRPDKLLVR